MNILELEAILEKEKVPKDLYSLKGGLPNERLCLEEIGIYNSEIMQSENDMQMQLPKELVSID